MKLINILKDKIKDENNFPMILFFIILINYIPLILPNMISKESFGVGVVPMVICFGIEILLLITFFYKKVKITEIEKKYIVAVTVISLILFIIQIKNFIIKDYKIMDFANIGCQFINIVLLFICVINLKIDEKKICNFMKAILYMTIVACIINMILYFTDILYLLGIRRVGKIHDIKSFFANRNQFAFFLYIGLIALLYNIIRQNKSYYKYVAILFLLNLFFTMSRTGIVAVILFIGVYFLTIDKISKKNKIKIICLAILLGIILLTILYIINPYFVRGILRLDYLKTLSGRTNIWARGLNIIFENPINFLFGVGRFKGVDVLQFRTKEFSQFHNIYIDSLVTGGILELGLILSIYGFVIKSVFKSNIDKKYKNLYLTMFITYALYICAESFGRFSIGCSDTLCLIFFVTIPLLHANSAKEIKKEEE